MRPRITVFGIATLILVTLFESQLQRLVSFALHQGYSSHLLFAPVISIYFLWSYREKIFRKTESSLWLSVLFAISGVAAVLTASRYSMILNTNDYLCLTTLSFCFFVISIFLASFGKQAAVSGLFPLAMLLLFVPLPSRVNEVLIAALQRGSADLVYLLFSVLRVPVLREGFVFSVPGASIEIASECSGINSSIALLIVSLLVAYESFGTPSAKAIFVLASLPLSIVKNAIRIVTLTLLATHVDMSFLTGKLHHRGGFVFFLLTLAFMIPIWKLLKQSEDHALARRRKTLCSTTLSSTGQ